MGSFKNLKVYVAYYCTYFLVPTAMTYYLVSSLEMTANMILSDWISELKFWDAYVTKTEPRTWYKPDSSNCLSFGSHTFPIFLRLANIRLS